MYLTLFFLGLVLYVIVNFDLIKTILKVTPKMWELGYGRNILFQEFIPEKYLQLVSLLFVTIIYLILFLNKTVRLLFFKLFIGMNNKTFSSNLFFVGLFLLTGQFLFGNNYDYRLVYMGLLLPEILNQFQRSYTLKRIKYPLIVIYFFVMFASFLHRTAIPFQNYTQWFVGRNFLMSMKYISLTFLSSFGIFSLICIIRNHISTIFIKSN